MIRIVSDCITTQQGGGKKVKLSRRRNRKFRRGKGKNKRVLKTDKGELILYKAILEDSPASRNH